MFLCAFRSLVRILLAILGKMVRCSLSICDLILNRKLGLESTSSIINFHKIQISKMMLGLKRYQDSYLTPGRPEIACKVLKKSSLHYVSTETDSELIYENRVLLADYCRKAYLTEYPSLPDSLCKEGDTLFWSADEILYNLLQFDKPRGLLFLRNNQLQFLIFTEKSSIIQVCSYTGKILGKIDLPGDYDAMESVNIEEDLVSVTKFVDYGDNF